jgi:hypothetical protein
LGISIDTNSGNGGHIKREKRTLVYLVCCYRVVAGDLQPVELAHLVRRVLRARWPWSSHDGRGGTSDSEQNRGEELAGKHIGLLLQERKKLSRRREKELSDRP